MNTMLENAFIEKINALQTSNFLRELIRNDQKRGPRAISYTIKDQDSNACTFIIDRTLKQISNNDYLITIISMEIIDIIGAGFPDISNKDYYLGITFKDNKTIIELH